MKKVLIIAAFVAATLVSFSSCDRNKERCWVVTITTTKGGDTSISTRYVWGTSNEVDVTMNDLKKAAEALGYSYDYAKVASLKYKTESDCNNATIE